MKKLILYSFSSFTINTKYKKYIFHVELLTNTKSHKTRKSIQISNSHHRTIIYKSSIHFDDETNLIIDQDINISQVKDIAITDNLTINTNWKNEYDLN